MAATVEVWSAPHSKHIQFFSSHLLPIFAALIIYSVTWAFVWDEGFHLVAAQLIAGGKRPYLDFCFPQTPLNAYINSVILILFGDYWRPVHVLAALYLCATVWMVADFVQSRFPLKEWRLPGACAAAALLGLNSVVVQFGPSAQAYAISMLLATGAFRAALRSATSRHIWFALLAGLCAGGAAASTLLAAPISMVLLIWFSLRRGTGARAIRIPAYLIGCAMPFAPVLWLYLQGPRQTVFNVLQYQALFRRTNWGDANLHDLDALTSWLASPGALLLIALIAAAFIHLYRDRQTTGSAARQEFLLAAALGLASVLFVSTAHPTFERYYCVALPFLVILASLGIFSAGSRLATPRHAWAVCGLVSALSIAIFLRNLFDRRDDEHWSDYQEVADQVAEVTPIGANLYADELVYFLLQRTPPEGMAFSYAQKLDLPRSQEELMHVISLKELKRQMQAGRFVTLQTCRQSILDDFEPAKYFRRHLEPSDCDVFWQPKAAASSAIKQ